MDPPPPAFGDQAPWQNQFVDGDVSFNADEYSEDFMLLLKDFQFTSSIDSEFPGVGLGAEAHTTSSPVLPAPVINLPPLINPVSVEYHASRTPKRVERKNVESSAQMEGGETSSSNLKRKRAASSHRYAERKRRGKISEQTNLLHNLIPHFVQGDKTTMLKQVIDYVTFLKAMVRITAAFPFGILQRLGWMAQHFGMEGFLEIIDIGLAVNGMGPFLSDSFGIMINPDVPSVEFPLPPPHLNPNQGI